MNTRTALRAAASAAALATLAFGLTACGSNAANGADGMYYDNASTVITFDGNAVSSFEVACSNDGQGLATLSPDPVETGELNQDRSQLIWLDRKAQSVSVSASSDIVNVGEGQYNRMEEKDILSAKDTEDCNDAVAAAAVRAEAANAVSRLEQETIAGSAPLVDGNWYALGHSNYGEVIRLTVSGSTVKESYLVCGAAEPLSEGTLKDHVIDWTVTNSRGKRSIATVAPNGSLILGIKDGDAKTETYVAENSAEVKAANADYESACGSPITS